ncbi:T9SS sorting signal type C domain-containing protein [Flavobacterium sp. H122]|uniref:T9SS sorting signal type C domain-containing protein n=1 Tax=Flavobacterium sp. H122 TaxID=2529860 RepID=UPI0010AA2EAB|nr:T9SS sorting signal type C domain-containing protein [Flavobacterium sp. H122]
MRIKLLIFSLLFSIVGWGQLTESFEIGLPTAYTTTTSYTLNSGVWSGQSNGVIRGTIGVQSGTYSCQLRSQTGAQITTPSLNSVGTVTFYASSSTTSGSVQVNYSIDGGATWTPATGSPFSLTTGTPVQKTATINSSNSNILVQFYRTGATVYLDDININNFIPSSNINVSTTSLTGFTYAVGSGPSTEQSFDVSGSNLTDNLVLTAPGDYEISTASGTGFGSSVSLVPSSGTVASTPIYVRLKAGLVLGNYNSQNIVCTSTGATDQNVSCNGSVTNPSTVFSKGDFAVIGLNSNISCYSGAYTAGDDEISFITFKDIQNGDSFYITDNGYERSGLGTWGDGEGVYTLTRTGGTIVAGTVITIRLKSAAPNVEFVSPDSNWAYSKPSGFTGNIVMNSGGDQVFFMQGGNWNNPGGANDATYTPGNYLYAFNTASAWESLGNSTQKSGLPIELRCFSLAPGSATDFLEYTGPVTPADKLDWIARLNNSTYWTSRADCAGYLRMHVGQVYSVTTVGTYVNGVWTGAKNTDWFDCSNWQTLKVPDNTIDVNLNSAYAVRDAVVDVTSVNASLYNSTAKTKNLTISSRKVQLEANGNNKLEVYGDLLIDGTGALDMDDSTTASDGQLYLYGNWTNNLGNTAFSEGNGTVYFTGSVPQIINNVTPEGTETFYNVVLNNDFTTNVSNDLIANGDLTINTSKSLTIASNDYVQVGLNVVNNGNVSVQDDASLIQVDDSGTYSGSGTNSLTRTAVNLKSFDYVYWSSPQNNSPFTTIPNSRYYEWIADYKNPDGYGYGNWFRPLGATMTNGKGYIFRVPDGNPTQTVNFSGNQFNTGVITSQIKKGPYTDVPYAGTNGIITNADDNMNLVGNPYPSAIDALEFAADNSAVLENAEVSLWRHLTAISSSVSSPYYQSFAYNYSANDYVTYTASGSVPGGAFDGKIASGQAFFVKMKDDVAVSASANAVFNNSQRSRTHNNSQFFRTSNAKTATQLEKHRIWLDLVNPNNMATSQMVGYIEGATNSDDFLYEAKTSLMSGFQFYSSIDNKFFKIQGRQLPFDENDVVPLGVIVPADGKYKIAINSTDGLFKDANRKIYVEDKATGDIHDLTTAPYQFNIAKGNYTGRFVLRFTNQRLSNQENTLNENAVTVYVKNNLVGIKSDNEIIKSYEVYNVLGQLLKKKSNVNVLESDVLDLAKNNQALIVRIELENGSSINKKIIF